MPNLYPRWQRQAVLDALSTRRVVLIAGARQVGKTTLARTLAKGPVEYRTLDDPTLRQAAAADPVSFVEHTRRTLIIDEIQRVPALLAAIKLAVDTDQRPGRFLLTGSASLAAQPGSIESLAGRIGRLRLRPLTSGEIAGAGPGFLQAAFEQRFRQEIAGGGRDAVLERALAGGFPEALTLRDRDRRRWHRDYVAAILERDLKDVANIQHMAALSELVQVVAAWSSRQMDVSAIGAGLSIRRPTLQSYLSALEALYLVERLEPWTRTDYARVGKQPRLYMTDSGLMASLLGWRIDQIRFDADRSGKLVETFAFNEIAAEVDAGDGRYRLFHYRDREQREVDLIVEREDGALLGIEIKASSSVASNDFKHLRWIAGKLAIGRPCVGVVLYTGDRVAAFGPGLWAVPFAALWQPPSTVG